MKIGFIGCGNMAKAIIAGLIKTNTFLPEEIIASDNSEKALSDAKICTELIRQSITASLYLSQR